ncbi:MAG: hypothetical protein Q9209_003151 [Squamulea sp. 1 TL-2023]
MERIEHASVSNPNDNTSSLAKRTLMWVACSYRALSLAELQQTLEIYDKQTLLEITAGLLYVDSDEKHVRLCHATAQEHFDKSQEIWFPDSASQIARSCVQYLNRKEFSAPCEGLREDEEFEKHRDRHPFLQYAYSFLGNHAINAGQNQRVHATITQYLKENGKVDAFIQAAWYLSSEGTENRDVCKGANGPAGGQTPLIFACRRGHTPAVALLLQKGAPVNTRNNAESTALFEAVIGNHADVVAILLSKLELNVNEELLHSAERTPLIFAVRDEYVQIVRQLLDDPRTDVNKKDLDGCTALSIAAKAGSSISIGYLIKQKAIDLDATYRTGNPALMHAAMKDQYEIFSQLLDAGADPSLIDQDGGTALLRAIDRGNTAVVEIMLDHGSVDDSIRDNSGRTLLSGAATTGRADIARLLMSKGLDKDAQDNNGKTPLHEASGTGEAEVVTVLLAAGANQTIKDHWDRSPWDIAWTNR